MPEGHWANEVVPTIRNLVETRCLEELKSINVNGCNALTVLALVHEFALLKAVVALGFDLDANNAGSAASTLTILAAHGEVDAVDLLCSLGASVQGHRAQDAQPIHDASMFGHVEVIGVLLHYGADINALTDYDQTPLDCARTDDVRAFIKSRGGLHNQAG